MQNSKPPLSPLRHLARLLNSSEYPTYLLDHTRKLIFANTALITTLNASEEQLLGLDCSSIHSPDASSSNLWSSWLALLPGDANRYSTSRWRGPWPHDLPEGHQIIRVALPLTPSEAKTKSTQATAFEPLLCFLIPTAGPNASVQPHEVPEEIYTGLLRLRQMRGTLDGLLGLMGTSPEMERCVKQVQVAVATESSLWISGDEGTGKTELAHAIFMARVKRHGVQSRLVQWIPIQCALVDGDILSNLVENIPSQDRRGSSTWYRSLLLENIEELSMEALFVLNTFLEKNLNVPIFVTTREKTLTSANHPAMVRLIAKTAIQSLQLPSLAERPQDIPMLAEAFLAQWSRKSEMVRRLSATSNLLVQTYPWPRNLREFFDALTWAAKHATNQIVEPPDFPIAIRTIPSHIENSSESSQSIDLDQFLEQTERTILERALRLHGGNRASAARSLSISRSRLLRRLEQLGIEQTDRTSEPRRKIETAEIAKVERDTSEIQQPIVEEPIRETPSPSEASLEWDEIDFQEANDDEPQ